MRKTPIQIVDHRLELNDPQLKIKNSTGLVTKNKYQSLLLKQNGEDQKNSQEIDTTTTSVPSNINQQIFQQIKVFKDVVGIKNQPNVKFKQFVPVLAKQFNGNENQKSKESIEGGSQLKNQNEQLNFNILREQQSQSQMGGGGPSLRKKKSLLISNDPGFRYKSVIDQYKYGKTSSNRSSIETLPRVQKSYIVVQDQPIDPIKKLEQRYKIQQEHLEKMKNKFMININEKTRNQNLNEKAKTELCIEKSIMQAKKYKFNLKTSKSKKMSIIDQQQQKFKPDYDFDDQPLKLTSLLTKYSNSLISNSNKSNKSLANESDRTIESGSNDQSIVVDKSFVSINLPLKLQPLSNLIDSSNNKRNYSIYGNDQYVHNYNTLQSASHKKQISDKLPINKSTIDNCRNQQQLSSGQEMSDLIVKGGRFKSKSKDQYQHDLIMKRFSLANQEQATYEMQQDYMFGQNQSIIGNSIQSNQNRQLVEKRLFPLDTGLKIDGSIKIRINKEKFMQYMNNRNQSADYGFQFQDNSYTSKGVYSIPPNPNIKFQQNFELQQRKDIDRSFAQLIQSTKKSQVSKSLDTFNKIKRDQTLQQIGQENNQNLLITQNEYNKQSGAVPTPKMDSIEIVNLKVKQQTLKMQGKQKSEQKQVVFSYLDDVLIQEDIKNVNEFMIQQQKEKLKLQERLASLQLLQNQTLISEPIQSQKQSEQNQYVQTPRTRMQIKKQLNDVFKENFDSIEKKNYDKIIINTSIQSQANAAKKKIKKKLNIINSKIHIPGIGVAKFESYSTQKDNSSFIEQQQQFKQLQNKNNIILNEASSQSIQQEFQQSPIQNLKITSKALGRQKQGTNDQIRDIYQSTSFNFNNFTGW
eukprot:403370095